MGLTLLVSGWQAPLTMKSPIWSTYAVSALTLLLGTTIGSAQLQLTWDSSGTTAPNPSDGGGVWLDSDKWWDGSAHTTWNNATHANTIAVFGNNGGSGTVTIGTSGVSAGGLRFNSVTNLVGYLLDAGTLTLATGSTIDIRSGASNPTNTSRVRFGSTSILKGSNISISNAVQGTAFASYATLSGNNTWTDTLTLTGNSTGLFVDATSPNALNSLSQITIGSSATLALNQHNTAYGSATFQNINIQGSGLGNRGSLRFDGGTVTLNSNITLTGDGRMSTNTNGVGMINGIISGNHHLTIGSDTDTVNRIVLNRTNTFNQLTIIKGNVQVGTAGAGTTGLGVVNLAGDTASSNPAILSGTGTARSGVFVSGGIIRPGDSGGANVGTFNVTLNLNYTGTSGLPAPTTVTELTLTTGGISDRINVGGDLRLHGNGNIVLAFSTAYTTPVAGDFWTLYTVGGQIFEEGGFTYANNIKAPDISAQGYGWQYTTSGNNIIATIVAIPEASHALLALTGLGFMAARRRRL